MVRRRACSTEWWTCWTANPKLRNLSIVSREGLGLLPGAKLSSPPRSAAGRTVIAPGVWDVYDRDQQRALRAERRGNPPARPDATPWAAADDLVAAGKIAQGRIERPQRP